MNGQRIKQVVLTEEGLVDLKRELDELVKDKMPKVSERLAQARGFGDIIDNNEFAAARDEQILIESRISEIQSVLRNAQVVQAKETGQPDFVVIGSTVVVEVDGQIDKFTIVSTYEADPAKRKISNESPVGQALMNARVGEVVEVTTPIVRAKYKIMEIK